MGTDLLVRLQQGGLTPAASSSGSSLLRLMPPTWRGASCCRHAEALGGWGVGPDGRPAGEAEAAAGEAEAAAAGEAEAAAAAEAEAETTSRYVKQKKNIKLTANSFSSMSAMSSMLFSNSLASILCSRRRCHLLQASSRRRARSRRIRRPLAPTPNPAPTPRPLVS